MSRTRLISALLILVCAALPTPGVSLAQDGNSFPVPPGRLVVGDETGLYTILADGSDKTYLVEEDDPDCWLRDGAWSPDGSQLVYTRICGGTSPTDWHATDRTASVFVYDMASGSSTEVVANDGTYQDYVGGWHPDGEQIVIYSNRSFDRYNLFAVDVVSGETTQLTNYDSDVGRASWDPSGRYVLYNRYIIETDQIRWEVRALDTTDQSEIPVAVGFTPGWSPDGQWIVYATEGETADVFVMPADCIYNNTGCNAAEDARNITYTPDINEREPLWSPDQTQVAYLRDTNPEPELVTWDIFRQDLRTGLLQQLTDTPDIKERHSAWEPVANATRANIETVLPVVGRVTTATANLRDRPTTNANIVGVLNSGQIMYIQGANTARDWYWITLPEDGATAWIWAELVVSVAGDPADVPEMAVEES